VHVEKIKVKVYVNQGKSLSHACIDDALSPQLNLTVDPAVRVWLSVFETAFKINICHSKVEILLNYFRGL
jgi:hypothetical protein